MRTSSHGPFRTFMMIFPLIAVAFLAYLGGYHYHTLAATQAAAPHEEPDLGGDIVVLGDDADAAPQMGVDELFTDAPSERADDPPASLSRQRREPEITIVADSTTREAARSQPGRRVENRRPRRYPSAAMDGWQFADDRRDSGGDDAPAITETTAVQPNHFDDELDAALDRQGSADPRPSRLQAAIDARRSSGSGPVRWPENDALASASGQLSDAPSFGGESPSAAPIEEFEEEEPTAYVEEPSRAVPVDREIETAPAAGGPEYRDPRTLKEATQILRRWGIRKFKLETTTDGGAFRFLCGVTDLHNPSIRRLFIGEGDEPLGAVRHTLRQIEDWRAQQ